MIMLQPPVRPRWQEELLAGINLPLDLNAHLPVDHKAVATVVRRYPMRITPYFLSLLKTAEDPLGLQVIPRMEELSDALPYDDPLHEIPQSPVPGLIHRYPDRALFLVSSRCAVYCRYCMRKRMVGRSFPVNDETRQAAIAYIQKTPAVKEVILSGGDPFLLETVQLDRILKKLHKIPHVEVIRIHTRTPGVLPSRITPNLVTMLKQYHPLFINIQFNHPDEITDASEAACAMLVDGGISLGSQTVLLKGVNDQASVMMKLMRKLLAIRVKPYYLHHPDLVKGTGHFRTDIACGLDIVAHLRGRLSGMAIPQYMIDLPGGGGKVPLVPAFIQGEENGMLKIAGWNGKMYVYPKTGFTEESINHLEKEKPLP